MIYGVTNWRALYENGETRRRKNLGWVLTPNRHDSMAFGRLMAKGSEGLKIFGGWMVLLQLASRGPYIYRGILCDSDGAPYSIEDMAVKTRVLLSDLNLSIPVLVELGWMFGTEGDLLTIYASNPQPYGENEPAPVDSDGSCGELQGPSVEIDVSEPVSRLKNKSKSKKKNNPPQPKSQAPTKRGGSFQIPEQLKTEIFLETWPRWVAHLQERQGYASTPQLQSHLEDLANDAPAIAAERLAKAIELGFRAPSSRDKITAPPNLSSNGVADLAAKIESELGTHGQ